MGLPMSLGALMKAFDTAVALRDVARRMRGATPPPGDEHTARTGLAAGLANQLETRLTGVVVAALKEAFDRDHARLELEREQMEAQRRRAEEAMRLELRRQAADREVSRYRMLAGTALLGWVASVALLAARLGAADTPARVVMAVGWLLLLASLGAAFSAQARISASIETTGPVHAQGAGTASLWLLIIGLACAAGSLLL